MLRRSFLQLVGALVAGANARLEPIKRVVRRKLAWASPTARWKHVEPKPVVETYTRPADGMVFKQEGLVVAQIQVPRMWPTVSAGRGVTPRDAASGPHPIEQVTVPMREAELDVRDEPWTLENVRAAESKLRLAKRYGESYVDWERRTGQHPSRVPMPTEPVVSEEVAQTVYDTAREQRISEEVAIRRTKISIT